MKSRHVTPAENFHDEIAILLDESWRTAGAIHRRHGRSDRFTVARALERLWEDGRIERSATAIGLGTMRRGGGSELRVLKYRQKRKYSGV
jgi:hypothetical protein